MCGTRPAAQADMKAERLEDLQVWRRANSLSDAVIAILDAPGLLEDGDLRDEISRAIDSVISNIAEGFEQPTDKLFVKFLFHSKASNAEIRARVSQAVRKRYVSERDAAGVIELSDEVARMTTGLIKYLIRTNRRQRGTGRKEDTDPQRPTGQ
jgi:four helix bundle protein